MDKIKQTSLLTLSVMLTVASIEAEEKTPWWKKLGAQKPEPKQIEEPSKKEEKSEYVSKPTKTPWWKGPTSNLLTQPKQTEIADKAMPSQKEEGRVVSPEQSRQLSTSSKKRRNQSIRKRGLSPRFNSEQNITTTQEEAIQPSATTTTSPKAKSKWSIFGNLSKIFKSKETPTHKNTSPETSNKEEVSSKSVETKIEAKIAVKPEPKTNEETKVEKQVTTIVKDIVPAEKVASDKAKPRNGLARFFSQIFKGSQSATQLTSTRRIKRLGKENDGYNVPTVTKKVRPRGISRSQFNT